MIVEFTIKNYRSIKEEQTFSLYADDYKPNQSIKKNNELPENITYMPSEETGGMGILNVAAIYGANASGKSNVLQAFDAVRDIILYSDNLKEDEEFRFYDPYVLCEKANKSPTKFEMEFFCYLEEFKGFIRFIYLIEFDRKRILKESLSFYPKGTIAKLFDKGPDDTWETMYLGNYLKGKRRRIPFYNNCSYLSKIGDSAAAPSILKEVYEYLIKSINYISVNQGIQLKGLSKKKELIEFTAKALDLFDTGISELKFEKAKLEDILDSDNKLMSGFMSSLEKLPEEKKKDILDDLLSKALFLHEGSNHSEYISEGNISGGTRKLFGFIPVLFETFKDGDMLIIDELETKFHPHIAELIIKLFQDRRVNKKGAQLIFSTHSTELMDNDLLRRDQIWFTEKKKGETILFSLMDFDSGKVRHTSPFAKWYLEGRFGAIPHFNYLEISDLFVELMDNKN